MKLTLVIAGASSGKTAFALELLARNEKKYYLATAPELDSEMKAKINSHKLEREGLGIHTIEEQLDLFSVWPEIDSEGVVLLDCLTLWGSNQIFKNKDISLEGFLKELDKNFNKKLMKFRELIIVTNEIGLGGIAMEKEIRAMNSLLGSANQYIGKRCDEAWFIVCGIPKRWK